MGFIVDDVAQTMLPVALISGVYKTKDNVEYIPVATLQNNEITATKGVRLINKLFLYNPETQLMEEEDVLDEEMEILQAVTGSVIRFEKNVYLKKQTFDCEKESDDEHSDYQPIQGLTTESIFTMIKSYNFSTGDDYPKQGDLIFWKKRFWAVSEASTTSVFTPRERLIVHLSLKAINK